MGYDILLWHSLSLPYNYFACFGVISILFSPSVCLGLYFYFVHHLIHTIVIDTSVNRIWSEAHKLILTISRMVCLDGIKFDLGC